MTQDDITRLMGSGAFQFNGCSIGNLAVGNVHIENGRTVTENSEPDKAAGDGSGKRQPEETADMRAAAAGPSVGGGPKEARPQDSGIAKILRGIAPKVGKGRPYRWGFVFQAMIRKEYLPDDTTCSSFADMVAGATGISAETVRRQKGFVYSCRDKNANKIIDDICAEIEIIEMS